MRTYTIYCLSYAYYRPLFLSWYRGSPQSYPLHNYPQYYPGWYRGSSQSYFYKIILSTSTVYPIVYHEYIVYTIIRSTTTVDPVGPCGHIVYMVAHITNPGFRVTKPLKWSFATIFSVRSSLPSKVLFFALLILSNTFNCISPPPLELTTKLLKFYSLLIRTKGVGSDHITHQYFPYTWLYHLGTIIIRMCRIDKRRVTISWQKG